jgi:hypothetical protein
LISSVRGSGLACGRFNAGTGSSKTAPDLFSAVASSATAPDRGGEAVVVDAGFVEKNLGELSRSAYLSSYVL